jgi:hypothetical protein
MDNFLREETAASNPLEWVSLLIFRTKKGQSATYNSENADTAEIAGECGKRTRSGYPLGMPPLF